MPSQSFQAALPVIKGICRAHFARLVSLLATDLRDSSAESAPHNTGRELQPLTRQRFYTRRKRGVHGPKTIQRCNIYLLLWYVECAASCILTSLDLATSLNTDISARDGKADSYFGVHVATVSITCPQCFLARYATCLGIALSPPR